MEIQQCRDTHTHTDTHIHACAQLSKWQYLSINIDFYIFFYPKRADRAPRLRESGVLKFIRILLWALISCACPFCLQICFHCLRIPGCRCQSSGTSCPLVWAPRSGSSEARSWRRRWRESQSHEWWGWSGSGSLGFQAPWWGPAESFPEANGPESAGRWTPCRFACW